MKPGHLTGRNWEPSSDCCLVITCSPEGQPHWLGTWCCHRQAIGADSSTFPWARLGALCRPLGPEQVSPDLWLQHKKHLFILTPLRQMSCFQHLKRHPLSSPPSLIPPFPCLCSSPYFSHWVHGSNLLAGLPAPPLAPFFIDPLHQEPFFQTADL